MARDVLHGERELSNVVTMSSTSSLPPLPSLECVMALQRGGFVVTSLTNERVVLRRDKRLVVVRRHRVLTPAELAIVLRAAEMDEEAFLDLLSPLPQHASGVRPRVRVEEDEAPIRKSR